MLTVMNNNRAYHQEVMHLQRMAAWRQRRMDRWHIATTIRDPFVSFAKLADAMGVAGIGPIENPNDLAPALSAESRSSSRASPSSSTSSCNRVEAGHEDRCTLS